MCTPPTGRAGAAGKGQGHSQGNGGQGAMAAAPMREAILFSGHQAQGPACPSAGLQVELVPYWAHAARPSKLHRGRREGLA